MNGQSSKKKINNDKYFDMDGVWKKTSYGIFLE
jgi:hypothetical protein